MKILRALVLGAVLLFAQCSAARAMTGEQAQEQCVAEAIAFVSTYVEARKVYSLQELLEQVDAVDAPLEIKILTKRFMRADFAGNREAAAQAFDELFNRCVRIRMTPKVVF